MSFVQKQQGHFSLDLDEARNGLRAFAAQVAQCEGGLVGFFPFPPLKHPYFSLFEIYLCSLQANLPED